MVRLAFAEVTRGFLAEPSAWREPFTSEKRRLSWAALRFAALADLTLLVNGPALKRKGHANGRLADILSSIFLGICAVRRALHEGRTEKDPLVRVSVETCLARIDEAFLALLREFDAPLLGLLLRGPALWWARLNPLTRGPRDADLDAVVEAGSQARFLPRHPHLRHLPRLAARPPHEARRSPAGGDDRRSPREADRRGATRRAIRRGHARRTSRLGHQRGLPDSRW